MTTSECSLMTTVHNHTILVSDYKMLDPDFAAVTTYTDNLSIQFLGTLGDND